MSSIVNFTNTVHTAFTPEKQLLMFLSDGHGEPQFIYNNKVGGLVRTVPSELTMKQASEHKNWEIREGLALATSFRHYLQLLAKDTEAEVRTAVALNPCTETQILERLCGDDVSSVARAAKSALTARNEPYELNEKHDVLLADLTDLLVGVDRDEDWLTRLSDLCNQYRAFTADPIFFWRRVLAMADALELPNDVYGAVMMWATALEKERAV